MARVKALREHPLFAELTDAELAPIAAIVEEKRLPEGTTIFLENMPGESMFIVKMGRVRISKKVGEGERHLLTLGPGEVFGEMTLFDGGPRGTTARVAEPSEILILKRSDLMTLAAQEPRAVLKLLLAVGQAFVGHLRQHVEAFRELLGAAPPPAE
ncbi:MAG TPA: cyclic nucleotide-binding domain-containing protein [Thermodesulfobacteriota bacterium]|nr:cyclic nucleotide-binding domain-containing protein [Thermodesulfobacteriota bacterium]